MSPHPRRSACTALRGAPRLPHNLATKGLALGMGILRARLLGPLPCPAPARASLLFLRNTKNKRTQDTCIRKSCCGNSLPPTPLGLCAASPYWGVPTTLYQRAAPATPSTPFSSTPFYLFPASRPQIHIIYGLSTLVESSCQLGEPMQATPCSLSHPCLGQRLAQARHTGC